MWAFPYLTYVAIAGMIAIVCAMAFIPDQRPPLIMGLGSLLALVVIHVTYRRLRPAAALPRAAVAP
jgi:GABA permease